MLNENGYFHSFDSFIQKWNVRTNFNCVKRILAANNIEEPLQSYENPLQPFSIKLLCSTTKGCHDIYNLLLGSVLPSLKSQNKWRMDMNLPDDFGWKYVYGLPFFLTKDSMLQWFQYRINHRILGTNRLMFKMGIVDKENCSFCNHFSETILHLFCECRYVDQF